MKKLLFSLILLLVSYVGFSQNGLSYQAVILDPNKIEVPGQDISGQPLVNGDVWMKFSIYNGSTLQFEEVHKTRTDAYGLVNLLIGSVSSASFNSLVWDTSQKSLQVFVSFNQGASYTKVSDQKLNYNPYALFAETAGKLSGVLPVANGGTGATTAADARANLGLDQVNNTSDVAKPVSTATKAALDLKANAADVTAALALKANAADVIAALALIANATSLSRVATTGSYTDLSNKPTIPSAYTLPLASASALGGIKVGANLSIDANGVLSAAGSSSASSLSGIVPIANGGTGATTVAGIKSVLGFNSPSVAVGDQAGKTNQGSSTVGVGGGAGATNQGGGSVAVGYVAGYQNQGAASIAIGSNAAQSGQGTQAVALGYAAGQNGQGAYSVAVGSFAGNSQAANSIALNATGASLNPSTIGFFVDPIRNASASNYLFYNTSNKEISYGTAAFVDFTTNQTIRGIKTFTSDVNINGLTFGKGAGSNNGVSTALGASALASNTTGVYNSAYGFQALFNNTTGSYNHALGFQVLAANTTGDRNNAFGQGALPSNTTGSDNVAIGTSAMYRNTTANDNIAIGTQALGNSLTGSNNVAIGSQALSGNSTSSNNTAVGYQSLQQTSGSDNTALGRFSLRANTTGSSNTAIGSLADVAANNLTNATAIGSGAIVAASNTIQLGNTDVSNVKTSGTFTAGAVTSPIYASTPQTLTDGSTITWNPSLGLNAGVTLGGNRTLNFSTTPVAGSYGTLVVTQDVTGGRTIILPSTANKILGSTSTTTIALSTAGGAKDILNFYYDGTNCFWNIGQGYGTVATSSSTTNLTLTTTGTGAATLSGTTLNIPTASSGGGGDTYAIGDAYGGGIVFYVYDGGKHGLIAATADQSVQTPWSSSGGWTRAQANGVGAGLKNTTLIIGNSITLNATTSNAATVCNEYSVTETVGGITTTYGDWYLPSKYELQLLYAQKVAGKVVGFTNGHYWSSNEWESIHNQYNVAWTVRFDNGQTYGYNKGHSHGGAGSEPIRARAIRAF